MFGRAERTEHKEQNHGSHRHLWHHYYRSRSADFGDLHSAHSPQDPDELSCKPFDQKDCPDSLQFEDFEAKLTTHHFLMGLSYRF